MNDKKPSSKAYWKVAAVLLSSFLLFILLLWLPNIVRVAYSSSVRQEAAAHTIQSTPTVDPTVTALNKQKLENDTNWLWNFGATLFSTFALFVGGIFAIFRWFGDRQAERERKDEEQRRWLQDQQIERRKRDEEHFQTVVERLGSTNQATQVGGAIVLRTFLQPGYEQFYLQAFDLAIAHLRMRRIDPNTAEPLDSFCQALTVIFQESFPLVRRQLEEKHNLEIGSIMQIRQLNASFIQLDSVYIIGGDFQKGWMLNLSARKAFFYGSNFSKCFLSNSNFSDAQLGEANLSGAFFGGANLSNAHLNIADLSGADLSGADLSGADLSGADLSGAKLQKAKAWTGAKLLNIKGLTPNQLEELEAKGAIIKKKNKEPM